MPENIEMEIRKALDAKAHEVEVPSELGARTLDAATGLGREPLWGRLKHWRYARKMRLPATGYPRWMYVVGAAATAVLVFVVGAFVTMGAGRDGLLTRNDEGPALESSRVSEGYDYDASPSEAEAVQLGDSESGEAVAGVLADKDALATGHAVADETLGSTSAGDDTAALRPPQLVRAANVRVAVGDFESAWEKANEIAADHNGFVIESDTNQIEDEIAEGTLVMRVPVGQLDGVLEDLRALGTLARLETGADDISEQLESTKDRVARAQEEQAGLEELLDRSPTVSQSLEIRERLERLRNSITKLKDQQAEQRDQVAFSTVQATIVQDEVAAGRGATIIGKATRTAMRLALTVIAGILVLLAALLPLAALALAGWFVVRTVRRGRPA